MLNIDEDLVLKTLLMIIKGESIKYSSSKKRENSFMEEKLVEEINEIENQSFSALHTTVLETKKENLEIIRKVKMQGHVVRSRAQYLLDGEKPTKYFCSLESKKYIEKTVRKVKLDNGSYLTDQTEILKEMQRYYAKLFASRDDSLIDVDLSTLLENQNVTVLNEIDANSLKGLLTVDDSLTLKKMKNDKTF